MPTTYRVLLETETRPREAAVALDHLPAIQVDAPSVDVAARLALSHHIDSRPTPPPAGTSFGLVVITPPPYDPKVPHHDLDAEAECTTSTSSTGPPHPQCTDRPLRPEQAASPSGEPRQRPPGGAPFDHDA